MDVKKHNLNKNNVCGDAFFTLQSNSSNIICKRIAPDVGTHLAGALGHRGAVCDRHQGPTSPSWFHAGVMIWTRGKEQPINGCGMVLCYRYQPPKAMVEAEWKHFSFMTKTFSKLSMEKR